MTPTGQGSGRDPATSEDAPRGKQNKETSRRLRGPHDTISVVIWSALLIVLGLGLFYGFRTTSNRDRLTERNLRELDRMGRTVQARLEAFLDILEREARERPDDPDGWLERAALIPDLADERLRPCEDPRIEIGPTIDLCAVITSAATPADSATGAPVGSDDPDDSTERADSDDSANDSTRAVGVSGRWTVDPIRRALDTDLFDAVFVADSGRVVLMESAAGGIRMRSVPRDTIRPGEPERTTVRSAEIAGRDYMVFLQPLTVRSPDYRDDGDGAAPALTVGGLVSTPRFRAESLALGPRHLLFLGLLLMLTVLGLPVLRVALMGPWERVSVRDVYLLGFSLVVTSGLMGLIFGDLTYYRRFTLELDEQQQGLAERLADSFRGEVLTALGELARYNAELECLGRRALSPASDARASRDEGFVGLGDEAISGCSGVVRETADPPYIRPSQIDSLARADSAALIEAMNQMVGLSAIDSAALVDSLQTLRDRERIFARLLREAPAEGRAPAGPGKERLEQRYTNFQMVFWTDPSGMQVAKWTPRRSNTARVRVDDRPYFTRIREETGWPIREGDVDDDRLVGLQHFVQSLRSKTTGENVAALSLPFCWGRSWSTRPCPREARGISVILTPIAAVDRPVLPPGFEFAVIEPDGRTLFHSRPQRNLDENFFEETGGNPALRSLVAARTDDHLNAVYMGRSSRLHVEPIPGTPLSLILVHDDRYPGTVHVQTLSLALANFGAWILILGVVALVVELVTPGRLQWVWPDVRHPKKYDAFLQVMAGFALVLVAQAALATAWPVHPSTLLVPLQAVGLGLVVLSRGVELPPHVSVRPWRTMPVLGWVILTGATAFQLFLHLASSPALFLGALQLAAVGWGSHRVATLTLGDEPSAHSRDPVRRRYVASAVLTLVVVGLLPGFILYQETFTEYLERLVRHEQVEIMEGLDERTVRQRAVHRAAGLPEAFDAVALRDTTGLAFQPIFESCLVDHCLAVADSLECRWERRATVARVMEPVIEIQEWYATDVAAEMGSLTRHETEGYRWDCDGSTLRLRARDRVLQSSIPSGLWKLTSWWLLGLIPGLWLLVWVPSWVGRRVFLLDLDYAPPTALADHLSGSDDESLIVVCTRSMSRKKLKELLARQGIHYVDLLEVMGDEEEENAAKLRAMTEAEGPICLDHFDQQLQDEAWARPLLARLEELVHVQQGTVVLLTSREPSALFPRSAEIEPERNDETHRWVRLLGQFVKVRVSTFQPEEAAEEEAAGDGSREKPDRLDAVLEREARSHPVLDTIADRIRRQMERGEVRKGLTADSLIDQIREMADSYYHALWSILEREEKLVVGQLAAGAVVNPKCERAVRRLLERKILVLGPELRLMNESFGRFVREEISPATVKSWEEEESGSAWQRLRFPILLGIGAVAAFLFVTQRTTFDAIIAIVSTAAVGTTAAVRLLAVAKSSGGKD